MVYRSPHVVTNKKKSPQLSQVIMALSLNPAGAAAPAHRQMLILYSTRALIPAFVG